MDRSIGTYQYHRVRTERGIAPKAVEFQAVTASVVLADLVGSGLVSASDVINATARLQSHFLKSDELISSLAVTGTDAEYDGVVRSVGVAIAFVDSLVTGREPSRTRRTLARLGGLFR